MLSKKFSQSVTRAGPEKYSEVLEGATLVMLAQRRSGRLEHGLVKNGLVDLARVGKLALVSDLHGDTQTLFRLLDLLDFEEFLSDKSNKLIFLGDYVDRGSDSVGVLYSICHLKIKYPDSVILMRGNHEAPAEFPFWRHDLPYEMQDRFGKDAKALYKKTLLFFKSLTLATVVSGKLLIVHGGLPTEVYDPKSISSAQENHVCSRVMEELLWNDPMTAKGWAPSNRGIGRYFGPDVTEGWLKSTGTRIVVRGHEPCAGFRVDHDGRILTLFSSKEAYPAFGAAYILVGGDRLEQVHGADDLAKCVMLL